MNHDPHVPQLVDVQDWSQWPYVVQAGRPNVAQHWPRSYPTITQTNAYRVYGPPPRPKHVHHLPHAILTFLTAGLWLPVWLAITIATHTGNTHADADYWSKIQRYWQWELAWQDVHVPPQKKLGG